MAETALIVGSGSGLSASLARLFAREGMGLALAARDTTKLAALCSETGARAFACDVGVRSQVDALFAEVERNIGGLDLVVYNPSYRVRGPFLDLEPEEVQKTIQITAFGAFLVARRAIASMLTRGHGSILFTGASASVKGYARSAPFAMGKFALRGLAQSLAREFAPQNIHIAHFVIDGGIAKPGDDRAAARGADGLLDPDAIATTYLHIHRQHRSAWTAEIELRPWTESY